MDPIRGNGFPRAAISGTAQKKDLKGKGFQDTLKTYTSQVNEQLKRADRLVQDFAVGKKQDLHEIMIATEEADLSFKLLLQIRNKLLEAYQEILRMQL